MTESSDDGRGKSELVLGRSSPTKSRDECEGEFVPGVSLCGWIHEEVKTTDSPEYESCQSCHKMEELENESYHIMKKWLKHREWLANIEAVDFPVDDLAGTVCCLEGDLHDDVDSLHPPVPEVRHSHGNHTVEYTVRTSYNKMDGYTYKDENSDYNDVYHVDVT